ncbi:MAG: S41 family peptidase [Minisyncoccia bacterium]|jgi:carboxyl-terminal processing protease
MRVIGKKALEIGITVIVGLALLGSGFFLGWSAEKRIPQPAVVTTGASDLTPPSSTGMSAADFSLFWQAWQTINDNYLRNGSTTNEDKLYGAVNGLVNSLNDPYSEFFTPQSNQQFQENITGDFGGIGAQLGTDTDGHIVVVAPLKGTPAEKAGLKPKDWIVAVDATSTSGMTVDDAVNLIRGPEGTTVTLSILRADWSAPKDFKITRTNIQVPNVEFEMKGNIAHVTLSEFTEDADFLFYQALVEALAKNAKGIVLDLRDDPGGYLEVAVDIAGYFLKPGSLVVKEVGRAVPEQDYTAQGDGTLSNFPIAVLINDGSASAAEILAGALHDDRHVPLVGETSFGKGTVQELEPLPDGSAIKLTVAHWVLPSGKIIDHEGIAPDYAVARSDDDIANGRDPQLDKAVQILQAETANQNPQ